MDALIAELRLLMSSPSGYGTVSNVYLERLIDKYADAKE